MDEISAVGLALGKHEYYAFRITLWSGEKGLSLNQSIFGKRSSHAYRADKKRSSKLEYIRQVYPPTKRGTFSIIKAQRTHFKSCSRLRERKQDGSIPLQELCSLARVRSSASFLLPRYLKIVPTPVSTNLKYIYIQFFKYSWVICACERFMDLCVRVVW